MRKDQPYWDGVRFVRVGRVIYWGVNGDIYKSLSSFRCINFYLPIFNPNFTLANIVDIYK